MNQRIESLHLVERACWQEMVRAVDDHGHGWRTMALASVDQGLPSVRFVVLREVDVAQRRLLIYTDERSPKVAQFGAQPRVMLVGWSRELSWQVRVHAAVELLTNGLEVSSRWARMKLSPSADDYLSPLAPGTPVEGYSLDRGTRDHFAVVRLHVHALDWLELHPDGNRRAAFDANGARWLVP